MNLILGGGLVALFTGLITIRSTAAKGRAEAVKAKADADAVQITNTDSATRILIENIVNPLREELIKTRDELGNVQKEMAATKREMAKLRKAVNDANSCNYADNCPVLHRLRESSRGDSERADGYDSVTEEGQCCQDGNGQQRTCSVGVGLDGT